MSPSAERFGRSGGFARLSGQVGGTVGEWPFRWRTPRGDPPHVRRDLVHRRVGDQEIGDASVRTANPAGYNTSA
jgi:hypothetical protein